MNSNFLNERNTVRACLRQCTSKSIPKAQAFVSEKADLEVAIRRNAEAIASTTKVLAHGRDEPNSGTEKNRAVMWSGYNIHIEPAPVSSIKRVYKRLPSINGESYIRSMPTQWHSFDTQQLCALGLDRNL